MVVPTTWNASPRDENGLRSAYESALVGTPVYDPKQPLEILRTIHSFDPCLACAVHLYDEKGKHVPQIDTLLMDKEAYFNYWFGTVRFIHFVAAFIFFFNFIFRLYWGFVGNRYAYWTNFIPLKKKQ